MDTVGSHVLSPCVIATDFLHLSQRSAPLVIFLLTIIYTGARFITISGLLMSCHGEI
jgi:hypothetical protein